MQIIFFLVFFSCWLNGDDNELIAKINRRMEALTGLNLDRAEDFQVWRFLCVTSKHALPVTA